MTKIFLFEKNGIIYGCQIKGHSGFDEEGKDIVCAAVSTAAQMALVGLEEVLNLPVEKTVKRGFMFFKVLEGAESEGASALFGAMKSTFESLAKDYAKNVKMEVKKDVI